MRVPVVALVLLAIAEPVAAQSTYIAASLVLDVGRYDRADYGEPRLTVDALSTDGEALGLGVHIGRALGERWGVEFEFARSGEIDNRSSRVAPFIAEMAALSMPVFSYELETAHRTTSYGALGWVRQPLGERVDLTFLGGIVFNRVEVEQRVAVTDDRLAQWIAPLPNLTGIDYSTTPAAGVQAGVELTESAAVTGGVRLHDASVMGRGGWLLRPSVGVRWSF